jgi:ATP-binding cassette subfamily F protein 3
VAGAIRKKIEQLQQDSLAKAGWAKSKEKQKIGAKGAKGHISRLSAKLAKRAKVAQKRIDKESRQLAEVKPFVPKELSLSFPKYEIRNRQVFSLEDVGFAYGRTAPLLESVSLGAATSDKICLMGGNGSGKSTLINMALGYIEPDSGERKINEGVRTAYLPQGLMGFFAESSLLENFADVDMSETRIRQYLGAALIRKDKVNRPVTEFSAGELMRAAVVKCILSRAEFLFLDEPTSHLDLESIEILERLLQDFDGGFLTVSHDRAFVENIADKLYYLEDGHLRLV